MAPKVKRGRYTAIPMSII